MHAAGLVHCDVKPSNIVYDEENSRYRLCDFGCAVEAFVCCIDICISCMRVLQCHDRLSVMRSKDQMVSEPLKWHVVSLLVRWQISSASGVRSTEYWYDWPLMRQILTRNSYEEC